MPKILIVTIHNRRKLQRLVEEIGFDVLDLGKVKQAWIAVVDNQELGIAGMSKFDRYWALDFLSAKSGILKKLENTIYKELLAYFMDYVKSKHIKTVYTILNNYKPCLALGFKKIDVKDIPAAAWKCFACSHCPKWRKSCFPIALKLEV